MEKNKIICAALCATILSSLTGCGSSAPADTAAPETTAAASSAETTSEETTQTEAETTTVTEAEIEAETEAETEAPKPKPEPQKDITPLRDVVASDDGLGADAICGGAIVNTELRDKKLMFLVENHFNAITIGNELKPDCMFGYHNAKPIESLLHTEELNGEEILVPQLDHSRADKILDKILEWNEENPDKQIKVRGHVLVWHSQTPEWFFHEDYDKTKPYVTPEEMTKRQEWYIKSMLTYYTGEDSKYKDLFYGWDVVNEAISDATNTYRTDTEGGYDKLSDDTHGSKSSWWKVYGSNEFIINAFRFANKYAPESLDLYYNDYNEQNANKRKGIIQLINDVKAADGTRITGFGMQGHYTVDSPSVDQFKEAIHDYGQVVDKVMVTELDVKVSARFNGTKEALPEELDREGHYFNQLYEAMKEMDKEDGYDVSGVVVWGIIDPNSWLQSRSNVGGGADGTLAQYPLLFDGDYQAKPAYWAFVDPSKLSAVEERAKAEMKITKGTVTIDGDIDDAWSGAEDVKLDIALGSKAECSAKLLWDEENLYVLAKVKDDVLNTDSGNDYEQDSIEVFLDENNSKAGSYESDDKQYRVSCENKQSFNGEKCNAGNMSSAAVKTDDGYIIEAAFKWTDITPAAGTKIGIELQINDANADGVRIGTLNWSDDSNTSYMNTSVFGTAELTE